MSDGQSEVGESQEDDSRSFSLPQTVTINSKRWRIVWEKPHRFAADCDAPNVANKCIRIDPSLLGNPQKLTRILLHECLHAAMWEASEEWVDWVSDDLARILAKFGLIRTY